MNDTPPPPPPAPLPSYAVAYNQAEADASHLRTLAICHFVLAGLTLLGIGFLVLQYYFMNAIFGNEAFWEKHGDGEFPFGEFWGLMKYYYMLMAVAFLIGAIANLLSGLYLRKRKNRTFSLVMAGCNCLKFPLGTILGVFTFIVLLRASVKKLYDENNPAKG